MCVCTFPLFDIHYANIELGKLIRIFIFTNNGRIKTKSRIVKNTKDRTI